MIGSLTEVLPPLAATIEPLGADARESIAAVSAMGYRAVQLSATQPGMRPRELDAGDRRGLRGTLQRLGIVCGGVDLWIPPAHLTDPVHVDRAMSAIDGACGLAADMGRCALCVALPEQLPAESWQAICATADRHGVRIADFCVRNLDASRHADAPPELVGTGIDPAALISAGIDPALHAASLGRRVAAARVVDLLASGMRGPPGEPAVARLDLPAFAAALALSGGAPSCCADARQWVDPRAGLECTLARWSGTPDPLGDPARARHPSSTSMGLRVERP
jgi:sugar phosphate isomerase/epimerase